ncbi:MAG: hypothetical protein KGJ80_20115 [Chloroflexota bacterium]|nr:hypothetical protein [Chloroflexota bacterium]
MLSKRKFIIAGALVAVLLVAGIGGTIAFAQGPASAKTMADLYLQTLAQKLGTTVEKLQQAMTDARKESAAAGVKQGLITQTQADRMLGNTAVGTIAQARLGAAATALGMSSADLTTALKTKTLLTLAQEKNVDIAKLRTAIADGEKAALDQAVKDGKLTQAQVDALKANIKPENIDLTRPRLGALPRGRLGRPGGMGMPPFGGFGMH